MDLSLRNRTQISTRSITDEGFLSIPNSVIARSGIYEYQAQEIWAGVVDKNKLPIQIKNKQPTDIVKILYPEKVLFHESTMNSMNYLSITNDHPEELVNSSNITRYQKGLVKNGVKRDGDFAKGDVIIQDQALVNEVQEKKKEELSTGVFGDISFKAGVDPNYGQFDGQYESLNINHLAVVGAGRAGSNVRLSNKNKDGVKNMDTVIKIDGVDFTFDEQSAQAVQKLVSENAALKSANTEAGKALKALGSEKDKLNGELIAANAQLEDESKLEERAEERAELINTAKAILPELETAKKSNAAIMREVVLANSKVDVADENDDVVAGIFKHMALNHKPADKPADKKDDLSFLKNKDKKDENVLVTAKNSWAKRTAALSAGKAN